MARARLRDGPIRYIIATHSWLEGARLSRRCEWANIPYPDEDAAAQAAQADAKGQPFQIERLHVER